MGHGANFYNRLNGYLEFILRGPGEVQLRISNTIVLALKGKVTEDKFFEPGLEGLVDNVRLLLNIPAERIAAAGVGDFEEAKSLARSRRNPSLGTHAQTNATTRVVDLVITDVSTTALPSSPRDAEQISTFQEETIYRNTAADLRRLSEEVIGNASRLTAGTNLSLTETISIKQAPIEPIPGWTCNSTMYADGSFCDCNCGAWDPDCDLYQPQHRGCPTTLPFPFSDDSCVSANMLRSYCVNASSDVSCVVAVPSEDLCPEWPCARDLGQVRGECTASDELLRVIEATQSNKFTCEKASSEDGEVEIGRCSLTLLNNDGVVLSANRTQTGASNTTTKTNVTFTTNATNTQETIEDQNSMDLPASPQSQTSSSVPSSPRPDVPAPVPSSPRPDAPHRGPSRESAQARRDRRRDDRARQRRSIRRLQRQIARRFSVSQEDLRNATTLSSIVELAQAEVQEAQRSVSTLQTKYASARALYKGNRTATNKAARRQAKINLRNGRKQLRRANNKLELLEELSRALTTPEQGGTFALGMGNPRGRENSMLVVAVAIGACAMAFIAVRSHRRANERLYVDESTALLSRRRRF